MLKNHCRNNILHAAYDLIQNITRNPSLYWSQFTKIYWCTSYRRYVLSGQFDTKSLGHKYSTVFEFVIITNIITIIIITITVQCTVHKIVAY